MQNKGVSTQRQLRVGELIRHILAQAFLRHSFIQGNLHNLNLSVAEVRITPDMSEANVYVTGLTGIPSEAQIRELNCQSGLFRKQLAKELCMKKTPRLHFVNDTAAEQGRRIEAILNSPKVRQDWEHNG